MLPLMLKRKTQKHNGECDDEKGKQGALQQQRQRQQQLGTTDDAFRGGDYELRGRPEVRGCGGVEESLPSGPSGGQAYGRTLLHSDIYYDHCDRRRRTPSPVGSGEWALRECEVSGFLQVESLWGRMSTVSSVTCSTRMLCDTCWLYK